MELVHGSVHSFSCIDFDMKYPCIGFSDRDKKQNHTELNPRNQKCHVPPSRKSTLKLSSHNNTVAVFYPTVHNNNSRCRRRVMLCVVCAAIPLSNVAQMNAPNTQRQPTTENKTRIITTAAARRQTETIRNAAVETECGST